MLHRILSDLLNSGIKKTNCDRECNKMPISPAQLPFVVARRAIGQRYFLNRNIIRLPLYSRPLLHIQDSLHCLIGSGPVSLGKKIVVSRRSIRGEADAAATFDR